MNLFELTDPVKVAEAKRMEAMQARVLDREHWNHCADCGAAINPQFEAHEDGAVLCLTCARKRKTRSEKR